MTADAMPEPAGGQPPAVPGWPVTATACPVCGGPLKIPATGRRPTYCGKACRQAVYRARGTAARAAGRAEWLRRELAGADGAWRQASRGVDEVLQWLRAAPVPNGGPVPAGWEDGLAVQAAAGVRVLRRVADLAQAHRRAVADYQAAVAVLRRAGFARPGGDETGAGPAGRGGGW